MSRRKRKQKNIALAKEQSGHTPRLSDWEQLATNPVLSSAFRELAEQRAVRSSSGAAPSEFLDFRHALSVIDQHPELVPYIRELQHSERREMLRESTMLREAPTGSYPQASSGGWSFARNQPQGVPNASTLRYYADNNVWTRAAINERRTQIGSAEIAVGPIDPEKRYDQSLQDALQLILDQPNELRQNWSELASSVLEDIP